jgi:hypothetical protein
MLIGHNQDAKLQAKSSGRKHLLFVYDEVLIVKILKEILQHLG